MSALDRRRCGLTSLTDLADSTITCHDALQLMICMVSPTCTRPSGGRGDDSHRPSFVVEDGGCWCTNLQRLDPRCSHVVLRDALGSATMCRG